jgi:hypothetical protein
MGYAVTYRSTRRVDRDKAVAVDQAATVLTHGRTWLSCEPVHIRRDPDGHLSGLSKPAFQVDPSDAASAAEEGLPDGTTRDVLEILCQLSREHEIDWEIGDDYRRPIGYIRKGVADAKVVGLMEVLASVRESLEGPERALDEDAGGHFLRPTRGDAEGVTAEEGAGDDEDDDGPPILPFRPKGG